MDNVTGNRIDIMWPEDRGPVQQFTSVIPDPAMPAGLVGIEVEVENCPRLDIGGWKWHEENSLRSEVNSEYVVDGAVCATHAEYALNWLFGHFLPGYSFSPACSTHVHVNTVGFTDEQLATLFSAYYSVEPLMFGFVGEERRANNYCVPWGSINLHRQFRLWEYSWGNANSDKYASMNLRNMRARAGTVEFRHFPGAEDRKKLLRWIAMVVNLVNYARATPYAHQLAAMGRLKDHSNVVSYVTSILGVVPIAVANYHDQIQSATKQFLTAIKMRNPMLACTPRSPLSVKLKLAEEPKKRKRKPAVAIPAARGAGLEAFFGADFAADNPLGAFQGEDDLGRIDIRGEE